MSTIILLLTFITALVLFIYFALQTGRAQSRHSAVNQDIFPELRVDLGRCGQIIQAGWTGWSGNAVKTFNTPFGSFSAHLNSGKWGDNGELMELEPDNDPRIIKTAKADLFRDGYVTDNGDIILTFRGLKPGNYTITLYSCNSAQGTTGYWADFKIKLIDAGHNNAVILKEQHTYARDAYSYAAVTPFTFTSNGNDDIVITMARTRGEIWLNGFIITPINLAGISFSHPMTVINQNELAIVRELIAKNIQPQASAYQKLLSDADEALEFNPDPPAVMNLMGSYELGTNLQEMRAWLWRNCHAAYACALAYVYSQKPIYADQAVKILNAWANKKTVFTGAEQGLQLGSYFAPMLYAADLIHDYPGWKLQDQQAFNDWWRNNCLVHIRDAMYSKDNHWKDAGILGVFASAVVLEEPVLFYEALLELTSYSYGDWKFKRNSDGTFLPREVVRNSGRNGITYTNYVFTCLVQALEIARNAGFNLWSLQTTSGITFKDAIEALFKWDVLNYPFPWNPNPGRKNFRKNTYEIANNHFELIPEIQIWLRNNRPVNGEQGDEYVTLNKGDVPPITPSRFKKN